MNVLIRLKAFFIIIAVLIIHSIGMPTVALADNVPLINTHIDTTLDPNLTYTVDGDVTVFPGATLTIPAGTHLMITQGSHLRVDGTLIAKGTSSNHISVVGGTPPPFIPFAAPVSAAVIPVSQSPEVQSSEVQDIVPVSDTSPQASPLTVTNGIMMAADVSTVKHYGFLFENGSSSTLSYVDISDGYDGAILGNPSTVSMDHVTFTNCDTGILGARGNLKLTNSSFTNVSIPVDWDFHGSFTHSNNTFSHTDIKGWRYGGDVVSGETMKLDSTDGEYYIPAITVAKNASLVISPGVTVFVRDGKIDIIDGTIRAVGTADNPITIYGDGVCAVYNPVFYSSNNTTATYSYVHFNNLCTGVDLSTNTTGTFDHDTFDTIAGIALRARYNTNITADHLTMHDIYQPIDIGTDSQLTLTHADISLVNGKTPAIAIHDQSPFSGSDITIDTARSCIGISNNSSMTVSAITLSHCSTAGIVSTNDATSGPSGISLTDSEIMNSGTAIDLTEALVINVSNNKFHDNTVGISLTNMPVTTVINNWWGSDSGPTIASNPTGKGNSIILSNTTDVIYRPWIGMTPPAEHNPIIIVPGITGSVLTKNYDDKSELWPNITKLSLSPTDSFLNDLELLQGGTPSTVRPVTVGDIIRSVSSTDVFSSMIATLEQQGYTEGTDLFVLPYDWRLSNTTNQALLKNMITQALSKSGKSKVNIMAHSMGGLLVKDYLTNNPSAPIDHLFYIGVPHLGAPKAFQTLMYGDDMGFKFSLGPVQVPLLDPDRVKTISQNMPAVYELLPSQGYMDANGSYVTDLLQSPSRLTLDGIQKVMTDDGRNSKMFPFAKTLHDATDGLNDGKFSAYDFVGCGATKTIAGFTLSHKQSFGALGLTFVPEHRIRYAAGDGVVPMNSADADNGAVNYYVTNGSHGTLPAQPDIQQTIVDILNGKVFANTAGIADSQTHCNLSGDIVEVHSPVSLDIYDGQGRHTGPVASGGTEFGIPNVQYDIIGDEKFAFLPSGVTYTIVNHAQAIGTYDMYVSHSANDDTITKEAYFNAVPLTSTKSVATFTISPATDSYSLSMDSDGDGNEDNTISPSAVLNAVQAADVTPPVTTATLSGTTLTLSATDDNAGVLNTRYTIDGTTWHVYTDPFTVTGGSTISFLSIDKAGNSEAIKTFMVPGTVPPPDTTPPPQTSTPEVNPPVVTPPVTTQTPVTTIINNTTVINSTPTDTQPSDTQPVLSLDTNDELATPQDDPITVTDPTATDDSTSDVDDTVQTVDTAPVSDVDTRTEITPAHGSTQTETGEVAVQDNAADQLLASTATVQLPFTRKVLIGTLMLIALLTTVFLFIKRRA